MGHNKPGDTTLGVTGCDTSTPSVFVVGQLISVGVTVTLYTVTAAVPAGADGVPKTLFPLVEVNALAGDQLIVNAAGSTDPEKVTASGSKLFWQIDGVHAEVKVKRFVV